MIDERIPLDGFFDASPSAKNSVARRIYHLDGVGDRVAIVDEGVSHTYAELRSQALKAARVFLELRDRAEAKRDGITISQYPQVAVCMRPGFQLLALIMGGLAAGVLVSSLSPSWDGEILAEQLDMLQPDLTLIGPDVGEALFAANSGGKPATIIDDRAAANGLDQFLAGVDEAHSLPPFDPDRPAMVHFTSGSTGKPKAVVQDHRHFSLYPCAMDAATECGPGDNILCPGSWAHACISFVLAFLRSGATYHQLSARELTTPSKVAKLIGDRGISVMSFTVSFLTYVLKFSKLSNETAPRVRHCNIWGEAVSGEAVHLLRTRFPLAQCMNRYGASEVGCLSQIDFGDVQSELEAGAPPPAGFPYQGARALAYDEANADRGSQLLAEAPTVMMGYYKDIEGMPLSRIPKAPRSFVINDRFTMDRKGGIVLFGRSDNLIKVNGHMVSLDKVETVLGSHTAVADAIAMRGVNRAGGAIVVAAASLEPNTDCNRDELVAFCRSSLPGYAVPQDLVFLKSIPRNTAGKADRRAVLEQYFRAN